MAETQVWRASRICQTQRDATVVSDGASRRYRAGVRLWALLRAPALLRGPVGGIDDVAYIEDDYGRLARRVR